MIVQELGAGKYSDCFKISDHGVAVAFKMSYYQEATIRAFARHAHRGNINAAQLAKEQDAISVATAMAEVAKHMRAHRVSPHFVQVHCEADVKFLPLRFKAFLKNRLHCLTHQQLKYSHVCIMDLYRCNLTALLRRDDLTESHVQGLLFQVVYTLACLQEALPGFRHNDLSTNNVLVKPCTGARSKYTFKHMTFYLADLPLFAAIADFDFTHVPRHEVLSNERVLNGKYGIRADPNDSYDTHLLMKSVLRCLSKRCTEFPVTVKFLRSLPLDKIDRATVCAPALVPTALLRHPYFDSLRMPKPHDVQYGFSS
jgi:hypothetical protein